MSATGRGKERRQDDAYETPSWCVRRLIEAIELPGGTWLEPSAGSGRIIRTVLASRSDIEWHAVEIRKECRAALLTVASRTWICDFLRWTCEERYDVCLMNPPFRHALVFIEKAMQSASVVVALVRQGFAASEARADFMRRSRPTCLMLPNRPSFTGGGTDSADYCWMVWSAGDRGRFEVLPTTSRDERLRDEGRPGANVTDPTSAPLRRRRLRT